MKKSNFIMITMIVCSIVVLHVSTYAELLDIPLHGQQKSSWCWAASTGAILLYYKIEGFTPQNTQEKILKHVKGSLVNKGGTSSEMQKALKMGKTSPKHLATYSEENLIADCDRQNPLMVNVKWNSSGAHATTYSGYQEGRNGEQTKHRIMNPLPVNKGSYQYFTYESLKKWNGKGRWNYSIITKFDLKPFITVSSPKGKEKWEQNSTNTITWNDNLPSKVKIELLENSTVKEVLAASVESNGSWEWHIDQNLTIGNSYKIRITSLDNGSVKAESADNFSVIEGNTPISSVSPHQISQYNLRVATSLIHYQIPLMDESSIVTIALFDVQGKLIKTLVNECKKTGCYSIDLKDAKNSISSGLYICRMLTDSFNASNRFIHY